ncbi:uncharacterized protein LOC131244208 [Magnolia sinica]|uniref:uncharacterized protein LOC131244208 n=1 Tax=Magnolia sinica TaxID=86752 RepID=UPI00265B59C7|nr:uncharacterized protein LOC131244208 [Magnolia sinica]
MMCRAFSIILPGSARNWYRQLKPKSISSFSELSRMFLTQIVSSKKSQKPTMHLFTLKQGNKEPLKDYIACFNVATLAQKYTNAEEFFNSHKNIQATETSSKEKRPRNEEPQSSNKKPDDRAPRDRQPSRRPEDEFYSYTLLNTSTEQIMLDIRGQRLLNWPICMKTDMENQDKRKYCRFHRDHGHNTSNCVDLKDEIETLIHKGRLRRYTKEERLAQKEERPSETVEEPAEIRTIYGGSSNGGDSNKAHKAHSSNMSIWPKDRKKSFLSTPAA